jgi:hypothetical protein
MTANCAVWGCNVMLKGHTLQQIICFGHWSSTWEVTVSTIMRKWTLTIVNGCECNSLTSDIMKFLNWSQDGRNASKCSELFRETMILQHLAFKLLVIYLFKLGIVNYWAHFKYTDHKNAQLKFYCKFTRQEYAQNTNNSK